MKIFIDIRNVAPSLYLASWLGRGNVDLKPHTCASCPYEKDYYCSMLDKKKDDLSPICKSSQWTERAREDIKNLVAYGIEIGKAQQVGDAIESNLDTVVDAISNKISVNNREVRLWVVRFLEFLRTTGSEKA